MNKVLGSPLISSVTKILSVAGSGFGVLVLLLWNGSQDKIDKLEAEAIKANEERTILRIEVAKSEQSFTDYKEFQDGKFDDFKADISGINEKLDRLIEGR